MESIIHELIIVDLVDNALEIVNLAASFHRSKPPWFLTSVVNYNSGLQPSDLIEKGDISCIAHISLAWHT